MLFFKPKQKTDEILPPPPPEDVELEEELKEKAKFFDEVLPDEPSQGSFPEENEFSDVVKELEKEAKPKKAAVRQKKKELAVKKILKRGLKQLKKPIKTSAKAPKPVEMNLEEHFKPESLDFGLPSDLPEKDIELAHELEELEEPIQEQKPKEVLEAQEEIKSAIDKIKSYDKPSIFKRLFAKKEKRAAPPEQPMPDLPNANDISKIQSGINNARQALMKFDLEAAKREYIEIMKLYNGLKPEEQSKVYQDVKELYFERKSAEELKV